MERLTVFDGEFWQHKDFPPVGDDTIDEFIDCVKDLAKRLAIIEDILGDDYDLDRLRKLVEADKDGQYIVLDQDTVLSMLAGASAIRQNNRLCLSTYLFDMKKKYGGPFQIDYIVAEENLRKIGYAALKGENHG